MYLCHFAKASINNIRIIIFQSRPNKKCPPLLALVWSKATSLFVSNHPTSERDSNWFFLAIILTSIAI